MIKLSRLAPLALIALALVLPSVAHATPDADASALKRCATPRSFTAGPFFADQVKARGVSCRSAREQVKRWGRTEDPRHARRSQGPGLPSQGGYRCVTRSVAYETSRARCTRQRARGWAAASAPDVASTQMEIRVRLFAMLRERAGTPEVTLDLPEGARVS